MTDWDVKANEQTGELFHRVTVPKVQIKNSLIKVYGYISMVQ